MSEIFKLKPGVTYKVIKEFTDFYRNIHKPGESWIFIDTNYLPYESGLTLNMIENGKKVTYRFQDEPDQQRDLLRVLWIMLQSEELQKTSEV